MHEFVTTTLTRTSLATVETFSHGAAWHGDPEEESFSRPTVIFTTHGRWRFHGSFGAVEVESRTVVLGHAQERYRCAHDERMPTDRTTFVTVDHEALGYEPLPASASIARNERLNLLLAGLTRAREPLHVDALTLELLLALRAQPPTRPRRQQAPAAAARELLDSSLDRNVTLQELARHVHVSPFHLHRLFREETGLPPHEYLSRRRLQRACDLLAAGASVTETAVAVGYSSPGYFATVFRRRFGITPSRYRHDAAVPRREAERQQR